MKEQNEKIANLMRATQDLTSIRLNLQNAIDSIKNVTCKNKLADNSNLHKTLGMLEYELSILPNEREIFSDLFE